MDDRGRFTDRLRQELSRHPTGAPDEVAAELATLLRLAGALHLTGRAEQPTELTLELTTSSGAVARRVFALLQSHAAVRPALAVRAAGGFQRRTTYGVRLGPDSAPQVAIDVGLLDVRGRPTVRLPDDLVGVERIAALRGAVLATGSVSAPGRDPHLELTVTTEVIARQLRELLVEVIGPHVSSGRARSGWRVVSKSGEAIGGLLAALGTTGAFLEWDEQRLRRQLRNDAQRLTNADAANLRRSTAAAATQTEAVERAIAAVGWESLDDDLRQVALARLANPSASLSEIGGLCDPPVGKSAVHRRLRRLDALAAEGDGTDG